VNIKTKINLRHVAALSLRKKILDKEEKKLILQKYSCATFYQNSVWAFLLT
jgi:hypothetical protein